MGYTQDDWTCINTIRCLAVSFALFSFFAPLNSVYNHNHVTPRKAPCVITTRDTHTDNSGRCRLQGQFGPSRCPDGHGSSRTRSIQQIYDLQPKESRVVEQRSFCSFVRAPEPFSDPLGHLNSQTSLHDLVFCDS